MGMETFADIVDRLGGYAVVAAEMKMRPTTVQSWRARNSIPPSDWLAVVELAKRLGVPGVTLDVLAKIAKPRTRKRAA
jgi:hypothetical protein